MRRRLTFNGDDPGAGHDANEVLERTPLDDEAVRRSTRRDHHVRERRLHAGDESGAEAVGEVRQTNLLLIVQFRVQDDNLRASTAAAVATAATAW